MLLCCLPFFASGQKAKADKLYKELGYKLAIPEYEKLEDMSLEEMIKVANSYRLNHQTEDAQLWYSHVVEQTDEPIYHLYLAQALQSNGYLKEAKQYYLEYHRMLGGEATDKRGELLAEAIDRIAEFKHSGVQVENETGINSENLDFSPAYFQDGIVFVSSRGTGGRKDKWMDENFMDMFFAEKNKDGSLGEPKPFSNELTTKFHEGPVVFAQNDHKIFFTRNQFVKGKRKNSKEGIMKQDIFMATKTGKKWSEAVSLPFNTVENEEVHPAISPDGRTLYFSSDRPGGYGHMDLYKVEFKGGHWGSPVNLGADVNTPGNDLFPFVHDDGTLYFASDGWGGLGGLDIFSTYQFNDTTWMRAQNIGAPFNSPKDDFGLILNTSGTEGYFASAREGGSGEDDIYSFKKGAPMADKQKKIRSTICVFDGEDNARLMGAKVTVKEVLEDGEVVTLDDDFVMRLVQTETENEYILKLKKDLVNYKDQSQPTYTTDENGEFTMELKEGRSYRFVAEKDGYEVAEEQLKVADLGSENNFCIPLDSKNCLMLDGITSNEKYRDKAVPGTTVTMINLCTGDELTVRSDENGEFSFPCLECGCEFIFKGEKSNFKSGAAELSTIGKDCKSGEVLAVNLLLAPVDKRELLFASNELRAGAVVELQNIFYDFDKYYIRDDARPDLDKVVELMKEYPTIVVELGSHTDSRGSKEYNQQLSQKRAEAAVDYIISRGIDSRRIIARGYGENQLRNHCADGVKCTETEHQFNRRTEVKIISNDEPGLEVKYIDNKPMRIDKAYFGN